MIGVDMVRIARFKRFKSAKDHFVQRVFTKREIEYCFTFSDPAPHLAGTYAAKEAVTKAYNGAHPVLSVEIRHSKKGAPQAWRGKSKLRVSVSITHEGNLAFAAAIVR